MKNKIIKFKTNEEHVVVCDVDNTLVLWSKTHRKPGKGKKQFIDPYTGEKVYLTPHNVHIRLLKQYKARGFYTIVWSACGKAHADHVVDRLGIREHVSQTLAKPVKHMDDKENIPDILGSRVFLENS